MPQAPDILQDLKTRFAAANLREQPTRDGIPTAWVGADHIHDVLRYLQAEADRRCPAADAEQLFVALRTLRREVELVLYPDEYHVYAMAGRPDRRVDRMTRMLDWFDAHLRA